MNNERFDEVVRERDRLRDVARALGEQLDDAMRERDELRARLAGEGGGNLYASAPGDRARSADERVGSLTGGGIAAPGVSAQPDASGRAELSVLLRAVVPFFASVRGAYAALRPSDDEAYMRLVDAGAAEPAIQITIGSPPRVRAGYNYKGAFRAIFEWPGRERQVSERPN
jgi:hypothetical protein